jgi:predicted acylesterase/phospholipase RssA
MRVMHIGVMTLIGAQMLSALIRQPFLSERTYHMRRKRVRYTEGLSRFAANGWDRVKQAADALWAWRFRPLFGWGVWFSAIGTAAAAFAAVVLIGWTFVREPVIYWQWQTGASILAAMAAATYIAVKFKGPRDWITNRVLAGIDLDRGLLHPYHFHRKLLELFADDPINPKEPYLADDPFPIVLVAAALEAVTWKGRMSRSQQVWAEDNTPLIHAIEAAMRPATLFPPLRLTTRQDIENWVDNCKELNLVDGAGISQNPLPALFGWLKDNSLERRKIAECLCGDQTRDRRVHIVHNVPIQAYRPETNGRRGERINIVKAVFISRELERRRDTRQEARQTNFMSALELLLRNTGGGTKTLTVFVDEIAPEYDIHFDNNLDPTPDEIRKTVAQGCRRALEAMYRDHIRQPTPCHQFLTTIAPRRSGDIAVDAPGVREICRHCTGVLEHQPEPEGPAPGVQHTFGFRKDKPEEVRTEFKHLDRSKPRIVFLGSGGVFRGSFHTGVVGALYTLNIHPDLVVGASVGALMGGGLCAISVLPRNDGARLLRELCGTFLCVDQKVALTSTLKNTTKQIGVRAMRIAISPASLARMIRKGGQADAGFAAVGAPPALTDAISQLFVIPHARTRAIASEFVAGHITDALGRFWRQVQRETLPSLNIETFLMGTSLLEPLARNLLGEAAGINLKRTQPYHAADHPVSFFCTTSDLYLRRPLLLGRDFLCEGDFHNIPGGYDFVNATLSSSAFPAVFAPRSEAQLLPGKGQIDVLLADGGMFDNLPFFPAIELLSEFQQDKTRDQAAALSALEDRQACPDLIIAAALDADPDPEPRSLNSMRAIRDRVDSLAKNVKSKSFAETAERVGKQTGQLLAKKPEKLTPDEVRFIDSMVPAGVLQVIPTDKEHINPTFAFCRSAGMQKARVQRSIADGCFQTLRSLAQAQRVTGRSEMLEASVKGLSALGRIPAVAAVQKRENPGARNCPFFKAARHVPDGPGAAQLWEAVTCPFALASEGESDVGEIQHVCIQDKAHTRLIFGTS